MKLNKREITLNEADSMQDVFRMEKLLFDAYEKGAEIALRKEVVNEIEALKKAAEAEAENAEKLWEKSKARQL